MITIKRIITKTENEKLMLTAPLDIDGVIFNLNVNIMGKEWHEFAVTDRIDAFLFGALPYAMRHGHDITCEGQVSDTLLFNLRNQYIPTLSKYDENLYHSKIYAGGV